jgi:hypothetical protein
MTVPKPITRSPDHAQPALRFAEVITRLHVGGEICQEVRFSMDHALGVVNRLIAEYRRLSVSC